MSTNLYSCFGVIHDLVINGSTSPIGELTNNTMSYAKEPDFYFENNKKCDLYSFRGISATSKYEKIPKTHSTPIINMLDWLYTQATQSKTTSSAQSCLQLLKATYTTGWTWVDVSTMVTNNSIWLPSSINFKYAVGGVTHEFKIWLANDYFEVEFPYREIYVIHPIAIADIDYFADSNYKQVKERIQSETTSMIETRVKKLLGDKYPPYSARVIHTFDVYDRINTGMFNPADWTVIYYGNPNDAEEETYEAIKACILANSKHVENDWADIIPDLFNPLEFSVVPYWNEIGMENETVTGSTYSPIYTVQGGDALPKTYGLLWTGTDVIKSLQIVPHLYKSAKMAFIGKPKNHNGKVKVTDIFSDYQLIPSTDSQAGMVTKLTSEFTMALEEMLAAGETVTPDGMPPKGIQRVTKNGRLYITKRAAKVKITMITRYQFIKDKVIVV